MISSKHIEYILYSIICFDPQTDDKPEHIKVQVADNRIRIDYKNYTYTEPIFPFNSPILLTEDFDLLKIIFESCKDNTPLNELPQLFTVTNYFKLIHYFTNEHYLLPDRDLDEHERITIHNVDQKIIRYLEIPITDILISLFKYQIGYKVKNQKTIYLTSDFDIIHFWDHIGIYGSIKRHFYNFLRGNWKRAFNEVLYHLFEKSFLKYNPLLNFNMYAKQSDYSNFKLTNIAFHLVKRSNKIYDTDNNYRSKSFSEFFSLFDSFDIINGIHPNYDTNHSNDLMYEQMEIFESNFLQKPIYSRNHYLKGKFPDNIVHLENHGILFDSTFGFHDSMLFRGGITKCFKPWSLDLDREINIIEIPLLIMDGTLTDYLNLDYETALEKCKNKIQKSLIYGNSICLLWHNRSTYKYGIPDNYHPQLISELISYIQQLDTELTTKT